MLFTSVLNLFFLECVKISGGVTESHAPSGFGCNKGSAYIPAMFLDLAQPVVLKLVPPEVYELQFLSAPVSVDVDWD